MTFKLLKRQQQNTKLNYSAGEYNKIESVHIDLQCPALFNLPRYLIKPGYCTTEQTMDTQEGFISAATYKSLVILRLS